MKFAYWQGNGKTVVDSWKDFQLLFPWSSRSKAASFASSSLSSSDIRFASSLLKLDVPILKIEAREEALEDYPPSLLYKGEKIKYNSISATEKTCFLMTRLIIILHKCIYHKEIVLNWGMSLPFVSLVQTRKSHELAAESITLNVDWSNLWSIITASEITCN